MKVIWTSRAARELAAAVRYIRADDLDAAARVARSIYQQALQLEFMPHIGRHGQVFGTRELVFPPWPYVVVYRVTEHEVRILRVRHASRLWP